MTPPSANAPTILAILSGKGGVGKTMLAAATAYELSRVQPTLILDLDFFNRGLSGLLLNNRLGDEVSPPLFFVDDSAAPWTVSKVTTNIYTVSFPDIPDAISSRLSSISVNSLATQLHDWILEITRATGCRAVVLDCHGGPDALSFAAATIANKSLLVSEPDRITMYGTLHFLRKISELSIDITNVHLVLNKVIDSFTSRFLLNTYDTHLKDRFCGKPLLALFPLEGYLTKHFEHRPFVTADFPESILARKTQIMLANLLAKDTSELVPERARNMYQPIAFFWKFYMGRTPKVLQVDFAMIAGFLVLLLLIAAEIAAKFVGIDDGRNAILLPMAASVPIWALFTGLLSWTKQLDQKMTLFSRRGYRIYFLCCAAGIFLMWTAPIELAAYVIANIEPLDEVFKPMKYLWYVMFVVMLFIWGRQVFRAEEDTKYSYRQMEPTIRFVLALIILAGAANVTVDRGFLTDMLLKDGSYRKYGFITLTKKEVEEGAKKAAELQIDAPSVFGRVEDGTKWYTMNIGEEKRYLIAVKAEFGDPRVGLFGADEADYEYIAQDDDGGVRFDSRLEEQLKAGTYYVGVRGFLGQPVRYWIGIVGGLRAVTEQ